MLTKYKINKISDFKLKYDQMNMLFKKSFKVSRISQKRAEKITHLLADTFSQFCIQTFVLCFKYN